jgi:hypothetical protein
MADYDSDSSLEGASEYTETSVLLGYATKEPTEDTVSHLGGHPVSTLTRALTCSAKYCTDMARSYILTACQILAMQVLQKLHVLAVAAQR